MVKPLFSLLFTILIFPCISRSQTQPAPRLLPYMQDFDDMPMASTVYPPGWQGWLLSGAPSGNYNTGTPASDKALLANGTASSTANGVYNYAGKLGFLNSGSADNSLTLAIDTRGQQNITLSYDAMTIRNPYDVTTNTRINEMAVQYRIGDTGSFTSITETAYQNDTLQQTGAGITLPQHLQNRMVLLPPTCNNQPLVQLRWVNRQISGGGSRPGFAIDNIAVNGTGRDTVPPVISTLTPVNAATDASPVISPKITFSEQIQAGNGFILLHNLRNHHTDSLSIHGADIVINAQTLTIYKMLAPHSEYYITADSGVVTDLSGNAFSGIADSTQWSFTTGSQELSFHFDDCIPGSGGRLSSGFTQYSVSGPQVWECTTYGQQNSNGIQINGYSGGPVENEDWLISPSFDLTDMHFPLLQFASRTAFNGPSLSLRVSTNYSGSGDPRLAGWTTINGRFPDAGSDTWKTSSGINLARFKQAKVYVAFVYTSGPAVQAARWTIDDFIIADTSAAPATSLDSNPAAMDFDYVKAGQTSTPQQLHFWANDVRDKLVISVPTGFRVSRDSITYSNETTFTAAETNEGPLDVWVTFAPGIADQAYTGNVRFNATGFTDQHTLLSGTSLRSLKVVNWNIEWFGSPVQKPDNDSLQQANVTTILKKLDADVFALAEVVDTARFRAVVSQMPGYDYVLSDFGSYADSIADPDYVGAQKLAFLYKTSVIRQIRTYGVLRRGGSSTAYYNWSSGRFPYLMEATAKINNDSARMHFILIHAKANTGTKAEKITSWHRRKDGLKELKDTLDLQYPYNNIVMLGDFNDDLYRTITTELLPDTTSSYVDFLSDSINYVPLTRALSVAGQRSTVSYPSVIDNVMASNETGVAYVPASARIQTQVAKLVSNYGTTTTDHYPVVSRYNLHVLANPVPAEGFDAKPDGAKILVSWRTPYEINSQSFVIERSRNLRTFEPVDTVVALGTSSLPYSYISYDEKPWQGFSEYRLKINSLDGTVRYTQPRLVFMVDKDFWKKLLWCIFGHQLQYWLDWPYAGQANVQLIDINGRARYYGQTMLIKGKNYRTLDISELPSGIYFLRIQMGNQVQVSKIAVSH
ncbi:Ig-like domain-containing protein [Chitinophaga sp. 212800010-3]|uniref:Ig-like domain-containing protein n=1 Tax=unclassified Chitinophaga TaxID=2619133 RepID=UPI002DEADB73|nr:Big-5 domain-containing protein [Chitinophaga sp. 212800010-3]